MARPTFIKRSVAERRMKKGTGKGHGKEYTPMITVRDVASHGLASRIKGWKTKRVHHFLSNLELSYFYVLEWSSRVEDIREKYPLPIEATLDVAERLGIAHPSDPKTGEPIVIVCDFLLDVRQNGYRQPVVREIVPSKRLNEARLIEKFEIERQYWTEQGIDWGIATEREIPEEFAYNVKYLHSAFDVSDSKVLSELDLLQVEPILFAQVSKSGVSLVQAATTVDDLLGLAQGTCLNLARHLIATRQWLIDMNRKIQPSEPLRVERSMHAVRSESEADAG